MVTAIIMLNNNIFLDTDYYAGITYDEKVTTFAPVIEENRNKLSKTEGYTDYGIEICKIYVSTKENDELIKNILEDIDTISDTICYGCETDHEKIKAIAYWVSENIFYNKLAAETSVNSDTISLETVLKTKATTCAGYSNIFSALCGAQGIYCLNLRGGTIKSTITLEPLLDQPINHEWNAALADGEWVFVDTTWISRNTYDEDGYHLYEDLNDVYFDMSIEFMSFEHRIDLIDHRDFKAVLEQ